MKSILITGPVHLRKEGGRIRVGRDCLIEGQLVADSDNHSVRYSVRKNDLADWRDGGRRGDRRGQRGDARRAGVEHRGGGDPARVIRTLGADER